MIRWFLVGLVCANVAAQATAQGEVEVPAGEAHVVDDRRGPPPAELDYLGSVMASAGIAGELVTPVCDDAQNLRALPFAQTAATLRARRQQGDLVLDTGGLLARHGVVRFAARENPAALGALVSSLGYHALAFGEADLGDPRDVVLARLRALRDVSVPVLATNLRCEPAARELCDLLVTADSGVPGHALREPDNGGEEGRSTAVAVFSFIEPEAAARVGPDRMEGLRLAPLGESIGLAVRAARARGMETVIAIIDSGRGADAVARAMSALSDLPLENKPDVVLSAGGGSELIFARPAGFRPAVIAPPPMGAVSMRLRRNLVAHTYDILAQPVASADTPSDAVEAFMGSVGSEYCTALGRELRGGALRRTDAEGQPVPMSADDLVALAAGVMRERAEVDIAVLNRMAVDQRWQPANATHLTASDVQIGMQYDEPLVVGEVSAAWLRNLARSLRSDRALAALGLTIDGAFSSGEKIQVNGRALDDAARYTVVTVRFLAEGGDEGALVGATDVEWEPLEDATLRSALDDYLDQEREEDPRDALVDPWHVLEWTGRVNVDATFAGSAVRDRSDYAEGPLTNSSQALFGLNAQLSLNALSRNASWENLATASYSLARTAESGGFDEGADALTYRTAGLYRRFRADHDEVYVPDLLVEGLLRSELTKADERDYAFMNLRFVAGLQWRLHARLQARLVGGVEVIEALDPQLRSARPGAGAQLNVGPWVAMQSGRNKLTVLATLDYFLTSPRGRNRHVVQGLFDLALNLGPAFALTLNVTFYGLKDEVPATATTAAMRGDFALALQSTAGLRVSWTERWLAQ